MNTWCPQCGPHAVIDEDGCCLICGSDAVGDGADKAVALIERIKELEGIINALEVKK